MRRFTSILTLGLACACLAQSDALAAELSLDASKDTFLRNGAPNTNEGANKKLSVRKVGRRRAIVAMDLSGVAAQVPAGQKVVDAQLNLFISNNNKSWGKSGGLISAHAMAADWTEGNGSNAAVPKVDKDTGEESDVTKNRGSGEGATWHCATDTNIKNTRPNCSKKWKGGTYVTTPLSSVLIKNSTTGTISFDVTDNVQSFVSGATTQNFGWLIRKLNLSKAGGVWFYSSEASSNTPRLDLGIGFEFALSGTQEVPPITTAKSGECRVWLSNDQTLLNVRCTHNINNATAAHIHDGAVGVDGSVACDLGNASSPISATCAMTTDLVTKLNSGGLYVNIHSPSNSGGEIRGQIQ